MSTSPRHISGQLRAPVKGDYHRERSEPQPPLPLLWPKSGNELGKVVGRSFELMKICNDPGCGRDIFTPHTRGQETPVPPSLYLPQGFD